MFEEFFSLTLCSDWLWVNPVTYSTKTCNTYQE